MPFTIKSLLILLLLPFKAYAWSGFDYDRKIDIDIGPGNLVREGSVIQFYDKSDDQYHTAKVLWQQESSAGTTLQVEDLDEGVERTFLMES